jgi:prepilin-type N-terminal cleavage/methylation domain-containing protein
MNIEDHRSHGFTLIELVMVIAIIGILAAISVPKFLDLSGAAKESSTKAGLGSLRGVLATKYAQSATGGATASFPTSVAAADFAGGVAPKNAITTFSGVTATASAPGATDTHASVGFWYITASGLAGAFSDGTVDTSGY